MTAAFVKVSTPLVVTAGAAHVNVQNRSSGRDIAKCATTGSSLVYVLVSTKGKSPSALIFGTLALGVVGHVIGIF